MDIQLPDGGRPMERVPAVLIFTPSYRRFRLAGDAPAGIEPSPNSAASREMFVPRGYALVVVDVRGTGASFGCRDSFRSPAGRQAFAAVLALVPVQGLWRGGPAAAPCPGASHAGRVVAMGAAPRARTWSAGPVKKFAARRVALAVCIGTE